MGAELPVVLFVDDEAGILKSLRRLFVDENWQILLADSGARGLEILASEEVDLVVSDVRMPEMDGIEFLKQVKKLYPEVMRIFLSGYAEKQSVAEALAEGCALQILPKPWEDDELREVIKGALEHKFSAEQRRGTVPGLLNSLTSLPPLPKVYHELRKCLADRNNYTIDQVDEIIRRDMALSGNLLHWANSALFGQRRQVDSTKRAIMLLGIDIVESLVLSEAVARSLSTLTDQIKDFDSDRLQRHAMSCAILARLLAMEFRPNDGMLADRAFVCGLLHDIGLLAEAGLIDGRFTEIGQTAKLKGLSLVEAEQLVLQTAHPEVGAILAERWSLPSSLVTAIRWHHQPQDAPSDKDLTAIVAMADRLSSRYGLGIADDPNLHGFEEALIEHLGLTSQQIDELQQTLVHSLEGKDTAPAAPS